MTSYAVTGIGQLATLAGPARPRGGREMTVETIPDGAFVVRDNLITHVGTRTEIEPHFGDLPVLNMEGACVTPALVDAHTHAIFDGCRANEFDMRCRGATYQEIAASGGGILSSMAATRRCPTESLVQNGIKHLNWLAQGGVATVEIKSGYGLTVADEVRMLEAAHEAGRATGIEVIGTCLAAHAVPPEFANRAKDYLREVAIPAMTECKKRGLAEYWDCFVEDKYFTKEQIWKLVSHGESLGLRPRVHVDQLAENGGAQFAVDIQSATADHLEHTSPEGIRALAASGNTLPILLPASVFGLGLTRYPDARAMIEAGLPVVLATDFNPGSSPCPSLPMVMSLACTQMKMTPEECLVATTVNAAYSLGRGHRLGSLEVGKEAKWVAWDAQDYREIPYWIGRSMVKVHSRDAGN